MHAPSPPNHPSCVELPREVEELVEAQVEEPEEELVEELEEELEEELVEEHHAQTMSPLWNSHSPQMNSGELIISHEPYAFHAHCHCKNEQWM